MQTFAYGSGYYGEAYLGKRSNQEDEFTFMPSTDGRELLAVLADGMGGHAAGEVASELAVRQFVQTFCAASAPGPLPERLNAALAAANAAIETAVQRDPALAGMGCTLVGVHVGAEGLHWVSVGDSPLFLVRGGVTRQINQDHSMATVIRQSLEAGRITAEEAATHPSRNVLLSALMGDGPPPKVDLTTRPMPLRRGDLIIVASDGLQTLTDQEIGETIAPSDLAKDAVLRLIAAVHARDRPRQDNTTVQVVRIDSDLPGGGAQPARALAVADRTATAPALAPDKAASTPAWMFLAWALVLALAAALVAFMAHRTFTPSPGTGGWGHALRGWFRAGPTHDPAAVPPPTSAMHAPTADDPGAKSDADPAVANDRPADGDNGPADAEDRPRGANPGRPNNPGPRVVTPFAGPPNGGGPPLRAAQPGTPHPTTPHPNPAQRQREPQ